MNYLKKNIILLFYIVILLSNELYAKDQKLFDKKIALVIGNEDYKNSRFTQLYNPVNDSKKMKSLLKRLEFDEIIYAENADENKFNDIIQEFGDKITDKTFALFYFSGHGVSYDGENYLVPSHERITESKHIRYKTVRVSEVLDAMEDNKNGFNLVILDSCRNNPFEKGSGGLLATDKKGFYIVYAAGEGQSTYDSHPENKEFGLYTWELIKVLENQNKLMKQSINDIFSQIKDNVYKVSNKGILPAIYNQSIGENQIFLYDKQMNKEVTSDQDKILFNILRKNNRYEDYKYYISSYPNGKFVKEAKVQMEKLKLLHNSNELPIPLYVRKELDKVLSLTLIEQVELIQKQKIHFKSGGRYNLDDLMIIKLYVIANIIKNINQKKIYNIKVMGNTDINGTDEANYAIGLKRAKSVKDTLVHFGVNPDNILILSFGESNPVCFESTESCQNENRRVEFSMFRKR